MAAASLPLLVELHRPVQEVEGVETWLQAWVGVVGAGHHLEATELQQVWEGMEEEATDTYLHHMPQQSAWKRINLHEWLSMMTDMLGRGQG